MVTPEYVFGPALDKMERTGQGYFGPVDFQDYISASFPEQRHAFTKTAQHISIQTLNDLPKQLQASNVMVFRTGRGSFGLVRGTSAQDFFLVDDDFGGMREVFVPRCSYSDLFPFGLLGASIEKNGVNLAIASGLLQEALGLDDEAPRVAPAAGSSTYRFRFRPHHAQPELEWEYDGQVEIDALLMAKRRGHWVLFVIEAKVHPKPRSLAKYKLVYSAAALATHPLVQSFSGGLEIVPVYLRTWKEASALYFQVTECQPLFGAGEESGYVSQLCSKVVRAFAMPTIGEVTQVVT